MILYRNGDQTKITFLQVFFLCCVVTVFFFSLYAYLESISQEVMSKQTTSDDEDDIFARLGSSLYQELMADLSNLDTLELALEEHERIMAPPAHALRQPSLLASQQKPPSSSSAASVVVSHQAQRQASLQQQHGPPPVDTGVLNFDSLAAHEFLLADAKKKNTINKFPTRVESNDSEDGVDTLAAKNLVNSILLDDEEEDYNLEEEPPKFVVSAVDKQKEAKSLLSILQRPKEQQQQQQQPMPRAMIGDAPGMHFPQPQNVPTMYPTPPLPIMVPSPRILFNNPHVTRVPPIPANLVASLLMTSRDILYVVHTMLRPLLPLVENPYDNDYYFQMLSERHGMTPAEKPAWKDEKQHMAGKELHFRQVVVERAKEWKDDKQTLGHIVKTDVKRPRALVATPVLLNNKMDDKEEQHSQRAQLWKSRVLVDKGYQAHFELVEAQRLLRTNVSPERVHQLMQDVELNIALLHSCFGFNGGEHPPVVDLPTLRACLSFTKGQVLLARCMEERSLPHSSACVLLPHIICILFADARPTNISEVAIAKEERLCHSLTALVLLRNPSVGKDKLLQSLAGVVQFSSNLKKALGYTARAAVMHAVLSRGGEMFAVDASEDDRAKWLQKEMEFKNILSSS